MMREGGDRSLLEGLVGDGLPLIAAVGASLVFAGGLAIYLAVTGQLLPHDLAYLGMTAEQIGRIADGRLFDFMVHDRVAWGSTLAAVGVFYLWLAAFPLAAGRRWAWATVAVSGTIGFVAFASYVGTGYFDQWHAIGTVVLLPVFVAGVVRTRALVTDRITWRPAWLGGPETAGRLLVLATALGLVASGLAILVIGVTVTFVDSDLDFLGVTASALDAQNARLIPLIAHDRVGFAGAVVTGGVLMGTAAWWGDGPAVRQAIAVAGLLAFGSTLAVHLAVGYTEFLHLAPNLFGPAILVVGLAHWTWSARTTQHPEGGDVALSDRTTGAPAEPSGRPR